MRKAGRHGSPSNAWMQIYMYYVNERMKDAKTTQFRQHIETASLMIQFHLKLIRRVLCLKSIVATSPYLHQLALPLPHTNMTSESNFQIEE